MLEVWLPLLAMAGLGGAWYHVLRLRERAIGHARRLCARDGLQLLDDSVALHRLAMRWRRGTFQVIREYRFDISLGGNDRQGATLTLLGDRLVGARLPPRAQPDSADTPAIATPYIAATLPRADGTSGNVVPFERRRRTLH